MSETNFKLLDHYSPALIAQESMRAALHGFEYDWYAIQRELAFIYRQQQQATDDGMPLGTLQGRAA